MSIQQMIDVLQEPELEFGSGRHIDIRFGLMNFGPLDVGEAGAPRSIRLGLVGTPQTVEGVGQWIERCRGEVAAKSTTRYNLFPRFPGFTTDVGFRCELALEPRCQREISQDELAKLFQEGGRSDAILKAVELFVRELAYLAQTSSLDVLVCAPPALLDRRASGEETVTTGDSRGQRSPTFHDLVKAKAMALRIPLQLIFPATYGAARRESGRDARPLQDEATRAWNFHTALYYKAGGRPWRLTRRETDFTTCFIGVSFYQSVNQASLQTSMAQIFNERGHGVIVRGAPAVFSKDDRRPHLTGEDAKDLLAMALTHYRAEHGTSPARVVLHKTSAFTPQEADGFRQAARDSDIDLVDLIAVAKTTTRLFRAGAYPPLRGTLWNSDEDSHILYTRGSVDFYSAYPGLYVPRPLQYEIECGETTPRAAARELLELTKMNWNSTQFDNAEPITVHAARQVGAILKHVAAGEAVEHRYSYYM